MSQIRQVKLGKQNELRIGLKRSSLSLKLRLLDGKVEIFGSELPPNVWLTFPPLLQFAVFTWYGATIEIDCVTETEYTSDETPMINYLKLHNSLQVQRHGVTSSTSDLSSSQGPRVIIVGDIDSGKTTLAKMLLSWAAKDGCKPTFVDLNVGQISITIPGTISATSVEMPIDPVEGFPTDKALVHFFGHATATDNLKLFKALVEELARELEQEFAKNAEFRASGMVIDTMGWINGIGYELLVHAIRKLNASVVIVLGQEQELVNDLNKAFKFKKNVQILNLEKSDGVFSRDSEFRKTLWNNSIEGEGLQFAYAQNYFHGATNDLTVYTKSAKFSDVQVYQIGDMPAKRTRSAKQTGIDNSLKISSVKIDEKLLNKVLAISYAKQSHENVSSIVAGFVCITNVDMGEERITYISPSLRNCPARY